MILRRLSAAIRKQDWFTVVVETLIVVFGVFIGLQVNNWNEARREHERSVVYSLRLMTDMKVEYDYMVDLIDYMEATLEAGNTAYLGLTQNVLLSDEDIMVNAFRGSQYTWYERRRSTFDELVAAGASGLIKDETLRVAAFATYSTPLLDIMQTEGGEADYRRLFRQIVEPSVTEHLRERCGDKELDSGSRQMTRLTISYACKLEIEPESLSRAVADLRSRPDVLEALRLRSAQRSGRIRDMRITLQTTGMNQIFSTEKVSP
jgi:hypothetical protein